MRSRNTNLTIRLFRYWALVVAAIPAAEAQSGATCTAFVASQLTLRQEGTTEPAGDILINCSGVLQGAQTDPQTLSLYVNGAAITSRQLYTGTAPTSLPTEAALLVNDCITNSGTSSSGGSCSPSGTFTGGTPTQGFLQNGALVFSGFTLPVVAGGGAFLIRVTNVRVNANQMAAGSFVTGTVLATFGVQNQQNLVLGAVQSSLRVNGCQIGELLNTAFKSPASSTSNSTPGAWYQNGVNTESQTVLAGVGFTNALGAVPGLADAATRIRVNLSGNIPTGTTVTLPVAVNNGAGGSLMATVSGDLGPFSPANGVGIPFTKFGGSVTYEVRAQNGSAIDSFTIPITVTTSGGSGTGTVSVSATYASTTTEITTLNGQIPRFADTSVPVPLPSAGCGLTITTTSPLPAATVGMAYSQTLSADGGAPPYSNWIVSSGSLPPGLMLNSSTGVISGIPSMSSGSTFTFNVTVRDSSGVVSQPKTLMVMVNQKPSITKSFGASASGIALNGTTSLSFSIHNPNAGSSQTNVSFSDSLPSGLVVATPNGLTGSCGGGTIIAAAGSGLVSLTGATLAASASCNFSVNVQGTTAGVKNNSVTVSSTESGTGNTSTATLSVIPPTIMAPSITKSFGASGIALNLTTSLSFSIRNPNASSSQTNVSFTDPLPSGLVVATPNGLTGGCGGGTIIAAAGSNLVSLTGATLAASASCNFSVNVQGTTAGVKNNSVTVSSTESGTGNTSTATLSVIPPTIMAPSITKSFGASGIALNLTTSLSFSIRNPNASSSQTNVSFTDPLPSGLVVATPNGLTGGCGGGTIIAAAGSNLVSLAGATLTAGASCNFSVTVQGTTAGVKNNSVTVSSTEGGLGNTSTAALSVLAPATITAYSPISVPAGSAAFTLTLSGTNFFSASQVLWNSTSLPITSFSPTSLTAAVAATLLKTPTVATICVVNPSAGSCAPGQTSLVSFVVAGSSASNPAFTVQPASVRVAVPAGSTTPVMNSVSVRNVTGTPLTVPIVATSFVISGGTNWLEVIDQTPDDRRNGILRFTTDPTRLEPGSYIGYILYPAPSGTPGSSGSNLQPRVTTPCDQMSTAVELDVGETGGLSITSDPFAALTPGDATKTVMLTSSPHNTVSVIVNFSSGPVPMQVTATSSDGAGGPCWLSISPLDVPLQTNRAPFMATATPTPGLSVGPHSGSLSVYAEHQTKRLRIAFNNATSQTPALVPDTNTMVLNGGMGTVHVGSAPDNSLVPFMAKCNGCDGATLTGVCSSCSTSATGQVTGMTPVDLTVTVDPTNPSLFNPGQASITLSSGSATQSIHVTAPDSPMPAINSILSASAFGGFSTVAAGSFIEIYGSNFAAQSRDWSADFSGINAPTSLGGITVTIGGKSAFVSYIAAGQVNALVPSDVPTGLQSVAVTNAAGASNLLNVTVNTLQPGLLAPSSFSVNGTQYAMAFNLDGTYALPAGAIPGTGSHPAKPGDTIILFGTGFGPVTPSIPAGQLVQQGNKLVTDFQMSVGGVAAAIPYAGLAPTLTGVYQFNVVVPNVTGGNAVPLTFLLNGVQGAQSLSIAVGN